MGTRNLSMVIDRQGEIKVAQYGQWDGYPEGQGATILKFLRTPGNIDELKNKLHLVKFYNKCDDIKDYLEGYDKRAPQFMNSEDLRTSEDKYWFNNFTTRDIGGNILENIVNVDTSKLPNEHMNTIYLYDDTEFGKDSLMCEYAYIVNLQSNKLSVLTGFNNVKEKEYYLFKTSQEEIDERFKDYDYRYYGCYLIKEYDLNDLPDETTFVEELNKILQSDEEEQ